MVLVSIDVDKAEAAIAAIKAFATTVKDAHNAATPAADRALVSTEHLRSDQDRFTRLQQLAGNLSDRVELAIAYNGGRTGGAIGGMSIPGMPITYETAGARDTIDGMRTMVGVKLAADLTAAMEQEPFTDAEAARLDAALASLQSYSRDETVMNALYDELGADGVVGLGAFFAEQTGEPLNPTIVDDGKGSLYRSRMNVLTAGLATFTASEAFKASERSAADGESFADTFADLGMSSFGGYYAEAEAVTQMLLAENYDASFLLDVGARFYENEQSPTISSTVAPFEAYFTALGKDADASLSFFSGDDREARAKYFIADRSWADDFDSMGKVLDVAATKFHTIGDPRAEDGAWVASATVDYLAQRGDVPEAGRDSIGHLLGSYIYDIDRTARGGNEDEGRVVAPSGTDTWDEGFPVGAGFDAKQLGSVMSKVLTNDDAVKAMARASSEFNNYRLGFAAEDWGGQGTDAGTLQSTANNSATLDGFILGTMGAGLTEKAKDVDDQASMFISLTAGAAGMIPAGGTFTTFLAETALEAGAESAGDKWAGNVQRVEDEMSTVKQRIYDKTEVAMVAALDNHGHLTPEMMQNNDHEVYDFFASGTFDPSTMSDAGTRTEFKTWISSDDLPSEVVDIFTSVEDKFDRGVVRGEESS